VRDERRSESRRKDQESRRIKGFKVTEKRPAEAAVSGERGLPSSGAVPLVVHLEEGVLRRIRTAAEAEGKDPETLAREFIVERLRVEEGRGRPLEPPFEIQGGSEKKTVEIYTDGGCRGNPGPGGWAALIYDGGPKPEEVYGAEEETTNQRMELRAAIEGLGRSQRPSRVRLHSDSAYLLNAMNQGWLVGWERNGWKRADKKPVKNADLWRELSEVARSHEVEWVKVKRHAGNPGNERCHALVQLAIDRRNRR
jgi:ribonuclease HI